MTVQEITQAQECDLVDLFELQKITFTQVAESLDRYDIPPLRQTIDDTHADINKCVILKYTYQSTLLAGSVRAYCDESNICRVGKLMVHPDFQGHGIGKALLLEIERYFPECKKFTLVTADATPHTSRLYKAVGYKTIAREIWDELDMHIMEKQR